jgi:hypothetical protein
MQQSVCRKECGSKDMFQKMPTQARQQSKAEIRSRKKENNQKRMRNLWQRIQNIICFSCNLLKYLRSCE